MVREETLSDAIVYNKVNLLRKDFFDYIGKNSGKVDANLPVFFGHVVSALENSFPALPEEQFDDFIDSITFRVLDASSSTPDSGYLGRVILNAARVKKRRDADRGTSIVTGLKLLKIGNYILALEFLKKYWNLDVMLGVAVAYCHYSLSLAGSTAGSQEPEPAASSVEAERMAREKMLDLSRKKPPLQKLPQLDVDDAAFLNDIFWKMILLSLDWFPHEAWFVTVGLEKAKISGNEEMRVKLLDIGAEQFYDDIDVLREMYCSRLDNKDIGGAAGIVNHLLKRYPESLEPVLLGLNLSLLTTKKITYHSFRKLAVTKGMPSQILDLFDFEFDLLHNETKDALGRLPEIEKHYPYLGYYVTALRHIANDVSSEDEQKSLFAKKAMLDSVEKYCGEIIRGKMPFR